MISTPVGNLDFVRYLVLCSKHGNHNVRLGRSGMYGVEFQFSSSLLVGAIACSKPWDTTNSDVTDVDGERRRSRQSKLALSGMLLQHCSIEYPDCAQRWQLSFARMVVRHLRSHRGTTVVTFVT